MKITLRKYGISGLEIVYEAFNVNVVEDVKIGKRDVTRPDGTVFKFGSDVSTDVLEMFMDITAYLLKERIEPISCEALIEAIALREHKNMGMKEVEDV